MTTVFGRTLVARAQPRGLDPRSLFHPQTHGFFPERARLPLTRVGLFETSSDVNACILLVHRLVECLDARLVALLRARYPKATFLKAKMLPDCTTGGEVHAGYAAARVGAAEGISGTVNVCDMPATFDRDNAVFNKWRIFRQDFLDYERDWDDELLSIMSADSYRKCQEYGRQANDWHARLGAIGVGVDGCPKVPSSTTDDPIGTLLSVVKWGVAGVILVGVVSLLRG